MRRVSAVTLVVGLLVVGCDGTAEETTVPTTVALTSTTAVTTTTSATTTTTVLPFAGIVFLTPEDCDTCDDLADRLTDLARGEVPIQVLAAPVGDQRPAVQVMAPDGTVVSEWKGTEAMILPSERAVVENAGAMIRAACGMLDSCSPDTTSTTTTIPANQVLRPNDVQCGMEVERRYNFDGTSPAPLGAFGGVLYGYGADVLSGVLIDWGRTPIPDYLKGWATDYWYYYGDFCFGEDGSGTPIVYRVMLVHTLQQKVKMYNYTYSANLPKILDLLPFGNSREARDASQAGAREDQREASYLLDRLVVGRQYVFSLGTWSFFGLGDYITWSGQAVAYLLGESSEPPEENLIGAATTWLTLTGSP